MYKYDKPYRNIMSIDVKKNIEIITIANEMDSQEVLQASLINKIPLNIITDNDGNNLIILTLLNDNKVKTEFSKLNFIKFLVHNDVNPTQPNKDNQTALHIASQKQQHSIVKYLIEECNVSINYKDNNGMTPFHHLLIGDISLFEEKETNNLVLPKKEDIVSNKEDIVSNKAEIGKLIYNIIIKNSKYVQDFDMFINIKLFYEGKIVKMLTDLDDIIKLIEGVKINVNQIKKNEIDKHIKSLEVISTEYNNFKLKIIRLIENEKKSEQDDFEKLIKLININITKYNLVDDIKTETIKKLLDHYIDKICEDIYNSLIKKIINEFIKMNKSDDIYSFTPIENSQIQFDTFTTNIDFDKIMPYNYVFLNKDTYENCQFLIYPNEYSNTNILKQKYCLFIDDNIIQLFIDNIARPYLLDNDSNTIINPLTKTYHYKSIKKLNSMGIKFNNSKLPKDPCLIILNESFVHINKMQSFKNFTGPQYNEIKTIILANNKYGNNIINYIEESFGMCFYFINELLTDHLWKFDNDYTYKDMMDIFEIINNDISNNNISNNYLFEYTQLDEIKKILIPQINDEIMTRNLLENLEKEIKKLEKDKENLEKEKEELVKLANVNLIDANNNEIISNQKSIDDKKNMKSEHNMKRKISDLLTIKYILKNNDIIDNYNKIFGIDAGPYCELWSLLLNDQDALEKSWNISLLKILTEEKIILNDIREKKTEYEVINKYYSHIKDIAYEYFEGTKYIQTNKILKFVNDVLIHLTKNIICFNIEIILRNQLLKYFYSVILNIDENEKVNLSSKAINAIINLPDINTNSSFFKSRSFKDILYKDLPILFVKSSVKIFENQNEKIGFEEKSIKEILNEFFNLLKTNTEVTIDNSDFFNILNNDISEYFDMFVEKLIINWQVVLENVLKFVINQYRINETLKLLVF